MLSILWRSWLTFSVLIAIVLAFLTLLSTIQFDALLSNLIRQRLTVVAQTTAASFRPVVEMGLPISMMRNASQILQRAKKTDQKITSVHVFNSANGIILHSTDTEHAHIVSYDVLAQQKASIANSWSIETTTELDSGSKIKDKKGNTVGSVLISYPKSELRAASLAMLKRLAYMSAFFFVLFSIISMIILSFRLTGAIRAFELIKVLLPSNTKYDDIKLTKIDSLSHSANKAQPLIRGIVELEGYVKEATIQFKKAKNSLNNPEDFDGQVKSFASLAKHETSEISIARFIARQLAPWAGLIILGAALCLGGYAIREVNRAVTPEIKNRTQLIGSIVSTNIQRALDVGIPLQDMVGGQKYLGSVLSDFPELTYIGILTNDDKALIESGVSYKGYKKDKKANEVVLSFPVRQANVQVGTIRLDIDPDFVSRQFQNVFLDFVVVVLVAMLLSLEVMTKLLSSEFTAPFERLQRLAMEQAVGNFSSVFKTQGRNPVLTLSQFLSKRAEELQVRYLKLLLGSRTSQFKKALQLVGKRYGLSKEGPKNLSMAFINDIRLPLFIFVAAEELATPFLPLFAKSTSNPWPWLDQGIVISIPIIGYLTAIVLFSPFARHWADRLGHRRLIFIALIPAIADNVGLYFATTITEVILWRSVTGVGYALISLACQDYILDLAPKDRRYHALSVFVSVVIAGTFCGTAVGGVLADRLGPRLVFLIGAGMVLISGLLTYRFLARRQESLISDIAAPRLRPHDVIRTMFNPRFAALVLGIAIPSNILIASILWYIVPLVMNAEGTSTADIGRVLMLYYLIILIVSPIVAGVADKKISVVRITVIGGGVSGAFLLVPAIWPTIISVAIAVVGVGLGHALVRAPSVAVALKLAETELSYAGSNIVLGSLRALERIGSIVGVIVIAGISGNIGYYHAMAVTGIIVLFGAALFLIIMRNN